MVKNGKLRKIQPFCDLLSLAFSNTKTLKITFQISGILQMKTKYTMWKCKRIIILSSIISYCINFSYFQNIFLNPTVLFYFLEQENKTGLFL
jgi:hypothetical protein